MTHTLRFVLSVFLVAAAAHAGVPANFHYERSVIAPATGEACAVLDPAIFPHAAPALRDLRLFSGGRDPTELPYILTVSEAQQTDTDSAPVLDLRRNGEAIDFDLAMPPRPYTAVILDLAAQNFLATAEVTGLSATPGEAPTPLGQFTLFDLAAQHLSRNTTLALQESTFPRLRVHLRFHPLAAGRAPAKATFLPNLVRAATIPPSREQQVLFEMALATTPQLRGSTSVAHFTLPQHLPIERVHFRIAPGFAQNFLRTIHITAQPLGSDAPENATGTIARVHRDIAGLELRQQQMSVDATIGANLQGPAALTVTVDNAGDAPLPITAVELQVRQRKLCFGSHGEPLTLAYGDPHLYAQRSPGNQAVPPAATVATARIGPETTNSQWQSSPEESTSRRRQPHLIWVILLGIGALFGVVAIRASRVVPR